MTLAPEAYSCFDELVKNVRENRPEGLDQLYGVFRTLSASLRRYIRFEEFDDRFHDVFVVVIEAIRDGKLREPGALPGFIHGVARISSCATIGLRARERRLMPSVRQIDSLRVAATPEDHFEHLERVAFVRGLLASASARDREILTRFYLYEQTRQQICDEMDLTETQFRLAKSRAKARVGRRYLEQSPLSDAAA